MEEEIRKDGRGGKRPGAGRPKGTRKGYSIARPQHQVRAYDDEWELIKAFAKIVKKDPEKAAKILKAAEK
mgnify:FL=1|nr:MAG TPA: hypothetical protein [Caudoviricetes sp.]